MKNLNFKFGDLVTWKGLFAKANGYEKMVVIAIQPDNGLNGAIVCISENNPLDMVPVVCGPDEIKKNIKERKYYES